MQVLARDSGRTRERVVGEEGRERERERDRDRDRDRERKNL